MPITLKTKPTIVASMKRPANKVDQEVAKLRAFADVGF